MSNQELYDKVIDAYESGDENTFNAAARNWVENTESAPFEDAEANNLFSSAKRFCSVWRSGAINSRVSKLRMIECIRKIAEKKIPNPYREEIIPKKEKKIEHILGVVPKIDGFEQYDVQVSQIPEEPKTDINETSEEGPKKSIFGKRRKR